MQNKLSEVTVISKNVIAKIVMNFFYPKSYKYPSLLASLRQIRQKFFLEKEIKM